MEFAKLDRWGRIIRIHKKIVTLLMCSTIVLETLVFLLKSIIKLKTELIDRPVNMVFAHRSSSLYRSQLKMVK